MDSFNASGLQNQRLYNITRLTRDGAAIVYVKSLATFMISALGIPGNTLVIAVYFRQLLTSTHVYMFALGVADLVSCVCAVILTTVALHKPAHEIVVWMGYLTLTFSAFLLAFVSFERLLAVRRPHIFNLNATRAKTAIAVMIAAGATFSTILAVARVFRDNLLRRVTSAVVIFTNVAVMTVSYTLMVMILLRKARTSRRHVGFLTYSPIAGPSTVRQTASAVVSCVSTADRVASTRLSTSINKAIVKHAKTYRDIALLFIVTIVFVTCWTPVWFSYVGFHVDANSRRMYIVNSVVNPFIYSAVSPMFRNDLRLFYQNIRLKLVSLFI